MQADGSGGLVGLLILGAIVYGIVARPGAALIIIGGLMAIGFAWVAARVPLASVNAMLGVAIAILIMGLGGVAVRLGRIADVIAPRGPSPEAVPWLKREPQAGATARESRLPKFKQGERGYYRGHTYEVLPSGGVRGIAGEFRDAGEFIDWADRNEGH